MTLHPNLYGEKYFTPLKLEEINTPSPSPPFVYINMKYSKFL